MTGLLSLQWWSLNKPIILGRHLFHLWLCYSITCFSQLGMPNVAHHISLNSLLSKYNDQLDHLWFISHRDGVNPSIWTNAGSQFDLLWRGYSVFIGGHWINQSFWAATCATYDCVTQQQVSLNWACQTRHTLTLGYSTTYFSLLQYHTLRSTKL